jgi:HPt (histidine-containing phosphotransfer) domain-containing protein
MMGGDASIFSDALNMFITKISRYEMNLQNALLNCNKEEIIIHAHTLKGAARTVGALQLGAILEKMENDAHNGIPLHVEASRQMLAHSVRTLFQVVKSTTVISL